MWAISGLLGTTLGTIRRGTVKVWHEKAQRLRSSVYLGLHVPTARQRAERQVQVTLAGSLCFTMSSPAIMSAGGQVPRGTGVMCTSQGLVSTLHYGPLYRLNRNMCTKRSGPFKTQLNGGERDRSPLFTHAPLSERQGAPTLLTAQSAPNGSLNGANPP